MAEHFDAIVVGAGPAGNAAAYVMAKNGLKVLQLERGETAGSKNVQGAILYANELDALIPDFRDDAPLERHIIEQRIWVLNDTSYMGTNYRSDEFNEEKPNRYTIIRAQFDRWFSDKVKEAGGLVICETGATELIQRDGKVIGVKTDRRDGEVFADVVVLADGVNSLLGKKAGFHEEIKPEHVALAVKEMIFLPEETIQQRFGVVGEEGVVIELVGTFTAGMVGTGFLYTNKESISIGVGCMVGDLKKAKVSLYEVLERLKKHPSIRPMIEGGEVKEYAAHLIPEGGYKAIPRLHGEGWVMVGDAGGLVNSAHREGSNLAMASGRMAAETIIQLKKDHKPMTAHNLAKYRQTLNDSFVIKDLKKYKHLPDVLHGNQHFFSEYPNLLSAAAQSMLRVDGVDKKSKQKEVFKSFIKQRTVRGLMSDAIKLWRAFG